MSTVMAPDRAQVSVVASRTVVRVGPVSGLVRTRSVVVPTVVAALALVLCVLSVIRGDLGLPLSSIVDVLTGGGTRTERFVVLELRLPRVLVAVFVGLALGMAGALTAAMARNPLATPDVLGITAGASVAAVAIIVLGTGASAGTVAGIGLPFAALLGGLLAAAVVYLLAWKNGSDSLRLVLVGIAVSAFLMSITSWLLIRAQVIDTAAATVWLTGSLGGRDWGHVVPVAVAVLVVGAFTMVCRFPLEALRLGDDSARALGVPVQTGRLAVAGSAVLLASFATAAAGPIEFVALAAPQLAARLVGGPRVPVLTAGLVGVVLVLGADLIARTVLPVELPVGVVTAVLGAPYLLYLLVRRSREASA